MPLQISSAELQSVFINKFRADEKGARGTVWADLTPQTKLSMARRKARCDRGALCLRQIKRNLAPLPRAVRLAGYKRTREAQGAFLQGG